MELRAPFFNTFFLHKGDTSLSAPAASYEPSHHQSSRPTGDSHLSATLLCASEGRALLSSPGTRFGFCSSSSCFSFLCLSVCFLSKSKSGFKSATGLLWLAMRQTGFFVSTHMNALPSQTVSVDFDLVLVHLSKCRKCSVSVLLSHDIVYRQISFTFTSAISQSSSGCVCRGQRSVFGWGMGYVCRSMLQNLPGLIL